MQEYYEITSVEQLRAIADVLRLRIIDVLQEQPMTVTQVAEALGMAPARVHYHVRELEKVGLLRLVETREKGGILEKYYQPIARDISVCKELFLSAPHDESLGATSAWLDQMKDGFQRAFRIALEQKEENPTLALGSARLYITAEEQKQLFTRILELCKPYENRRGIEGEVAIVNAMVSYPQETGSTQATRQDVASMEHAETWTVGVAHFNREQLEKTVAEGKRLRINVTGICSFADDISTELADRAIERIHLIGKMQATPAICDVLTKKRV
ncbi:MAG TPA: helix-turn-helix domain-containing protein [Ktedonobacteraceae bacterium]|jgi:DNA-binding transcriptional ArsR family regulator|nr:helix-turn-helix domain-containing protein [Ktedonobacteraceae bacterium]